MKNTIAIIALFSLISLSAEAQKIATWKGGTPGKKNSADGINADHQFNKIRQRQH